jgi:anti-sigma factor ChrR (cupin superfamily)
MPTPDPLAAATASLLFPGLLARAQAADEGAWKAFRAGVDILPLYATADGHSAALLRYQPGAVVAHHLHVGFEHVLIISGSQIDPRGEHRAGTLVVNPPGSDHQVTSPGGCVVLAIWERPVEFTGK